MPLACIGAVSIINRKQTLLNNNSWLNFDDLWPKLTVAVHYFRELGKEYDFQNPIYTARTFPENVYTLDGEKAFPSWTGGLIGVMGKQMEDFAEFHKQWYINDLIKEF